MKQNLNKKKVYLKPKIKVKKIKSHLFYSERFFDGMDPPITEYLAVVTCTKCSACCAPQG